MSSTANASTIPTFTAIRREEEPRMERPSPTPGEHPVRQRTADVPSFVNSYHEEHATTLISRGIEDAHRQGLGLSASTARIIAAALHNGHGTHMERFAATGDLNPDGVLSELDQIRSLGLEHMPWVVALWDFLERIEGADPDLIETEHVEPAPMVFAQADDPDIGPRPGGAWLHTDVPAAELREQMEQLLTEHAPYSDRIVVTASVGFHGIDIPEDASAADVITYADGIRRYGEAYGVFARLVGYPVGPAAFSIRYENTYDTITEFMADHTEGLAAAVEAAGKVATQAREDTVDEHEERLRREWLVLDGHQGRVHVFTRKFGLPEREDDL